MAISALVYARCRRFLEHSGGSNLPRRSVLTLFSRPRCFVEVEEMIILPQKNRFSLHLIGPGALNVAPKTKDDIQKLKAPTTVPQLRLLQCLWKSLLTLLPKLRTNISTTQLEIEERTTDIIRQFNGKKVTKLQTLQKECEDPALVLKMKKGEFVAETSASYRQVWCVLLQIQPERSKRPIGYCSQKN